MSPQPPRELYRTVTVVCAMYCIRNGEKIDAKMVVVVVVSWYSWMRIIIMIDQYWREKKNIVLARFVVNLLQMNHITVNLTCTRVHTSHTHSQVTLFITKFLFSIEKNTFFSDERRQNVDARVHRRRGYYVLDISSNRGRVAVCVLRTKRSRFRCRI